MLYIVATPIGNLKDITYRAVEVLQSVDVIACEDTRHSLVLLNHYNIKKPLIPFHKFNAAKAIPDIIRQLKDNRNIALISDAGMPGISDPGCELVRAAVKHQIEYTVLPGACAAINAAVMAGSADKGFTFLGFLPEKIKERRELVEQYRFCPSPLIFYISPHSLKEDIKFLNDVYGDRKISLVKELTKLYEKVEYSTLAEIGSEARGEYVLIVDGAEKSSNLNELTAEQHLNYYIDMGIDKKQAIKQVAQDRGVHKNEIYKQFI